MLTNIYHVRGKILSYPHFFISLLSRSQSFSLFLGKMIMSNSFLGSLNVFQSFPLDTGCFFTNFLGFLAAFHPVMLMILSKSMEHFSASRKITLPVPFLPQPFDLVVSLIVVLLLLRLGMCHFLLYHIFKCSCYLIKKIIIIFPPPQLTPQYIEAKLNEHHQTQYLFCPKETAASSL